MRALTAALSRNLSVVAGFRSRGVMTVLHPSDRCSLVKQKRQKQPRLACVRLHFGACEHGIFDFSVEELSVRLDSHLAL